jgi:segregation and condensation protein A
MSIPVKLNVFEGPLDLLLHLIDKNKLNIYDIQISIVTDQYLEYIELMESNKMELMSEFIEMAATLINIKSKMLLPKVEEEKEEENDPRLELVEKLLEYKKYKLIAQQLKGKQLDANRILFKKATIPDEIAAHVEKADPQKLLEDICFKQLYNIFQSVMKKNENRVDLVRSKFGEIKKEEYTIQDKIDYIKSVGKEYSTFSFRDLLENQIGKNEMIVTFLAILELMKIGIIKITQNVIFDDIYIEYVDGSDKYADK